MPMPCTTSFTAKFKRVLAVLCALAAFMSLSACAPQVQPSGTASVSSTASASSAVTAQRGGELSLPMSSSPASTHPLYLNETSMVNL